MKFIPLTQGYHAMVDDDDFEWLSKFNWQALVRKNTVYAQRGCVGKNGKRTCISMHRHILGLTDPKILGEHADGNGLNNQRSNLRPATHSQNSMNSSSQSGSSSVFKGVSWDKSARKWEAHIKTNGKKQHLGYFDDENEAARHYNQKARDLFGDFARYNAVDPLLPTKAYIARSKPVRECLSGEKGVSWIGARKKWLAQIRVGGKRKFIGRYKTVDEAKNAYEKAKQQII